MISAEAGLSRLEEELLRTAVLVVSDSNLDISATRDGTSDLKAAGGDAVVETIISDHSEVLSGSRHDDVVTVGIELEALPLEVGTRGRGWKENGEEGA